MLRRLLDWPYPARRGGAGPAELSLRMQSRYLQLVLGVALAAGANWAWFGSVNEDEELSLSNISYVVTGLVYLAFIVGSVRISIRALVRGVDAGPSGLVVTNLVRRYHIPWDEVDDIDFYEVQNQGGGTAFHRMLVLTPRGSLRIDGVAGSTEPGGLLDTTRAQLLALRDRFAGRS